MAIQGIFTSNQGIIGERVGDFASSILQLYPTGTAPLLALSSGMAKADAADTVFTWFEDSHISGRSACVSGGTGTTVVVADGSFYIPGTVLLVEETGEHLLVTATAANSLTVIRGLAGTSVVSITSSMHVQQIGNAQPEGSNMPTAVNQQGYARMNYVQIFRNAWAITGTAKNIKFVTGNKTAKNKRECAMYHAEDQERAFMWGRKHIGTLSGKQFRMTDGVLIQIAQNGGIVESAASGSPPVAGDYSLGDFDEFMRRIFANNVKGQPNERIAFCGDFALAKFNRMVRLDSSYDIKVGESKHGINVTEFMGPFGRLKLMTHPLMNENPVWQKELYVFHPGGIRRRVFRETFPEDYDKNGNRLLGVDADQGVITTEAGIEVGAAATMGILRNINKAVATTAG